MSLPFRRSTHAHGSGRLPRPAGPPWRSLAGAGRRLAGESKSRRSPRPLHADFVLRPAYDTAVEKLPQSPRVGRFETCLPALVMRDAIGEVIVGVRHNTLHPHLQP